MSHSSLTSILFVDGTNLDHRLTEGYGRLDIDLGKLFDGLSDGTVLQHIHYFTAPYNRAANQEMYSRQMGAFNFLRKTPNVTIHLGRHQPRTIRCRRPTCSHVYTAYEEKGTDVAAAARLVHAACHKTADRLILVTNDNDFLPAVKICREEGAHVTIAYVVSPREPLRDQRYRMDSLCKLANRKIELDDGWLSECWRLPARNPSSRGLP